MKNTKLFQVEKIESLNVDTDEEWTGFAVSMITDPVDYCFECRDQDAAEALCNFLNSECIVDTDMAIDAFVMDNLAEWSSLITELSDKEVEFHTLKEDIFAREQEIIKTTNFKTIYGANNKDVRKEHLDRIMADSYKAKQDLEFSIDYLKRRISFLKALIHTKNTLMEVKHA